MRGVTRIYGTGDAEVRALDGVDLDVSEGEFLALVGADPVYRLLDAGGLAVTAQPEPNHLVHGTLGYHVRPGRHGIGPADWNVLCDFADAHFRRGTGR